MVVKHGAGSFATGSDSPVRVDSSTSSPLASSRRASAPITEPASTVTTLPRTRASADTVVVLPRSRTVTRIWCDSSRARTARSARKRWAAPSRALAPVTAPITAASAVDPTMADSAAPPARTGTSGLASSPATA